MKQQPNMIIEDIKLGGLENKQPKKPNQDQQEPKKLTIEERTEILAQLKQPNIPLGLRNALLEMLKQD